jgi:hypothetical protein
MSRKKEKGKAHGERELVRITLGAVERLIGFAPIIPTFSRMKNRKQRSPIVFLRRWSVVLLLLLLLRRGSSWQLVDGEFPST